MELQHSEKEDTDMTGSIQLNFNQALTRIFDNDLAALKFAEEQAMTLTKKWQNFYHAENSSAPMAHARYDYLVSWPNKADVGSMKLYTVGNGFFPGFFSWVFFGVGAVVVVLEVSMVLEVVLDMSFSSSLVIDYHSYSKSQILFVFFLVHTVSQKTG